MQASSPPPVKLWPPGTPRPEVGPACAAACPGLQVVSAGASALGEGPLWDDRSGTLLWVDIDGRQLHCLQVSDGEQRDWPLPDNPGCVGLVAGETARQVVIAMRSGFHVFDLRDSTLARLTDPPFDSARYRFNDGKVDSRGRFWAGTLLESKDEASAGLYCLERGRARVVTGAGAAGSPGRDWGVTTSNGLAFSPDGRVMYHSDTPAHVVYTYDFDAADGSIANRRTWWRADADRAAPAYGGRPDGAAVDARGCYWTAQYEGGRVLQLSPQGRILRALPVPARCPTMVAFGGPDLRTLYITTARAGRCENELREWPLSGYVFSAPVDVPGLPSNRYLP
ncbi:MAG: SMP-30/gluconolactonase/LRE family protein [Lautropia sp.]|nr:SMP-30/gluconolactonase/LRE family protein [Lautropia sp.]